MNQSNLFQRQCPEHPEKQVIYVCYNKSCHLNRLLCKICFKIHSSHSDDLLDEQEIEQKMKKSQIQCQQFIEYLNQIFNELKYQFKLIISGLEGQYNLSMEKFNSMQNKELNKYINELIIQSDKENTLNYLFTQGLNSFQEQINKCLNNLNLHEQQQKVFNKEEMEIVEKYYQQGYEYHMKGDFVNSIKMFDNGLQINQNHLQSLFYKGESLKGMNQYKQSIEFFDKVLTINHQHKQALNAKGDSLRLLCQFKESIIWFDKALTIDSKYKQALQGKGDSLKMLKQYTEAIKYFNSALQIDSKYGMSLSSKGACLLQLGQLDEAQQCLNQAIELNPDHQFNHFQLKLLEQKRQK